MQLAVWIYILEPFTTFSSTLYISMGFAEWSCANLAPVWYQVRSALSIFAAKGSWSPLQPVSAASILFDSYLVLTCRLKFNLMFARVVLVSYKPYHYNQMMYRCYNITSQNISSFCYGFSSCHYKCLLTFNTIMKSHGDRGVATYAGLTSWQHAVTNLHMCDR